jgi:hypothetical protein
MRSPRLQRMEHVQDARLDEFTRHYIVCALWSSTDESDESGGNPLDDNYGVEDIAPETLQKMIDDCAKFQAQAGELITSDLPLAGHDFWLTRNGHGAGFWDGDWPDEGEALTKLSKTFGEVNLYVGDDKQIYQG